MKFCQAGGHNYTMWNAKKLKLMLGIFSIGIYLLQDFDLEEILLMTLLSIVGLLPEIHFGFAQFIVDSVISKLKNSV